MKVRSNPKDHDRWDDVSAEEDTLLRFMGMSAEIKLHWLEQANRFLYMLASPQTRKLWERFRREEK